MAKTTTKAPAKASAKKTAAPADEAKNLPARRPAQAQGNLPALGNAQAPAFLQQMADQDKGKGLSSSRDDNLIPIIYVLQAQSPQVIKRNPEYLEGAEPGMLWLRNAAQKALVDGELGIAVQPCTFVKTWNEWRPRAAGGGFVKSYAIDSLPSQARIGQDPQNPDRTFYVMPDGNEIVETRNHIVIVHGGLLGLEGIDPSLRMPFSLSFSGGGHTSSRQWMALMNQFAPNPSFSRIYSLKTKFKQNSKGEWYAIEAGDVSWVQSEQDYLAGRALNDAFMAGEKKIDDVNVVDTGADDGNAGV